MHFAYCLKKYYINKILSLNHLGILNSFAKKLNISKLEHESHLHYKQQLLPLSAISPYVWFLIDDWRNGSIKNICGPKIPILETPVSIIFKFKY